MTHVLHYDQETATDAVFVCSVCGEVIGFNKAESSDPHATKTADGWVFPENPDQWMSPCTQ